MLIVAVDWDDTCRDNSVKEFKWMPGALSALSRLNDDPTVYCYILTARSYRHTTSIQYILQSHDLTNISVKCTPQKYEPSTKFMCQWDVLVDDLLSVTDSCMVSEGARMIVQYKDAGTIAQYKDAGMIVQYKDGTSWDVLWQVLDAMAHTLDEDAEWDAAIKRNAYSNIGG